MLYVCRKNNMKQKSSISVLQVKNWENGQKMYISWESFGQLI